MSSLYEFEKYLIPKSSIQSEDINTTISDNIICYDIENKGLLNLIKFKKIETKPKAKTKTKTKGKTKTKKKKKTKTKTKTKTL